MRKGAIVANRQVNWLDFDRPFELVEAFEEHVPVFRDHVRVPVIDIVSHTHREAVGRLREEDAALTAESRQVDEAAEGVRHT